MVCGRGDSVVGSATGTTEVGVGIETDTDEETLLGSLLRSSAMDWIDTATEEVAAEGEAAEVGAAPS